MFNFSPDSIDRALLDAGGLDLPGALQRLTDAAARLLLEVRDVDGGRIGRAVRLRGWLRSEFGPAGEEVGSDLEAALRGRVDRGETDTLWTAPPPRVPAALGAVARLLVSILRRSPDRNLPPRIPLLAARSVTGWTAGDPEYWPAEIPPPGVSTRLAHQMVAWLIARVCAQLDDGHPDARVIVVDGGYLALASRLGVSGNQRAALPELMRLLGSGGLPDGSGVATCLRERNRLEITVGTALLPTEVAREQTRWRPRAARYLVPLPPLPPGVGPHATFGAQANLLLRVSMRFRERAEDLLTRGAVQLPPPEWDALADRAGLPLRTLPRVRASWEECGAVRHAGGDGFTPHPSVVAFLREGAGWSVEGRRIARDVRSEKPGRPR